jgi:soluble lytic murein transglycosylase-like protein
VRKCFANLRWAAELAVSADEGKAQLGFAELRALADSDLLEAGQKLFIDAAPEAVVREPAEELEEAGEDARGLLSERAA